MPHSCAIYFNTSYVTVQQCFSSIYLSLLAYFNTSYVTVQQILVIKRLKFLMNFNTSYVTVQRFLIAIFRTEKVISIHLMLRFNLPHLSAAVFAIIFQYILCYGSTLVISNIDVCRTKFQYILCYGSTCV